MSTRYHAVDDYGLVIDKKIAKYMIEKLSKEDRDFFVSILFIFSGYES